MYRTRQPDVQFVPADRVFRDDYSSDDESIYIDSSTYERSLVPPAPPVAPAPRIVAARPRARTRYYESDRNTYVVGGLLSPEPAPAPARTRHHRSHSSSGVTRAPVAPQPVPPPPPQFIIDINNEQRDQHRGDRHEDRVGRQVETVRVQDSRRRSPSVQRIVEHRYSSDWDELEHDRVEKVVHHHHGGSHSRGNSRSHHRDHSRSHSHSRSNSPYATLDPETRIKLEKLDKLEREKKAQAEAERQAQEARLREFEENEARIKREKELKRKLELEEAQRVADKLKKKEEEERLAKKAVEEYERKKTLEAEKKRAAEEEADRLYEERVKREFTAAGYSKEHIDAILKRRGQSYGVTDLSKPTHIKVNKTYICPETLDHHHLPWEYDAVSPPRSFSANEPEN